MFGKINTQKNYVVVRSNEAGVWVGEFESSDGANVCLLHARKLWYWKGAKTTAEIATTGVAKDGTKATSVVREAMILGVCEILSMAPCAVESVYGATWDD